MKNLIKKLGLLILSSLMFYGCSMVNPAVNSSDKNNKGTFTSLYNQFAEPMNNSMNMMKNMMISDSPDYSFASMMVMHHQGAVNIAKAEQKNGKDAEMKKLADDIITKQESEIKVLNAWIDKNKAPGSSIGMMKTDDPFYKNMMGSVDITMMAMQNIGMGTRNECGIMPGMGMGKGSSQNTSMMNTGNNSMPTSDSMMNQDTANNFCMMGMSANKAFTAGNPDYTFAAIMLIHHRNAVEMAKALITSGKDEEIRKIAQNIVTDPENEVKLLQEWLDKNKGK